MDDKTRDLTTLRFEGPRFDDHGLDLDVLPELMAYKALLVETAKSLWRAQHPDRERLPRGFEASLSIKFYGLTEGSTGVPLKRVIPEDKGNLSLLEDELDQAADLLENTITRFAAFLRQNRKSCSRKPCGTTRRGGFASSGSESFRGPRGN